MAAGLIRATPLKDFRTGALSTTGTGTAVQLGELTTGQLLFGGLHLTCSYGSTDRVISMAIQSATASAFGSPATRIAFTLSTVYGAQWGTPTVVSTDHSWFRASWSMATTGSTNGSWKGMVVGGIG